ncbi:ubiquitin-protein ligase E3 [Schizosaccharomyces cryophilus OY26]|uniref:Ubiquitin-protein ligase E3 n=1 Tax=Schizosaccharomyces cryophilus (strain OY26 / ATCC MYA-4695 / CBS 11777 / NBRC 106824 / NRRL Y48691) TaxID=653667 RepID=S9WZM3_SCHCR|nr:ubiquitin-protein ligase E3 [Schizosaccharomyces cryophilus OY26]EPY50172.1 ubiquitin-protein ligase E3 [Schizosaccharomyces cryophilus OY26]
MESSSLNMSDEHSMSSDASSTFHSASSSSVDQKKDRGSTDNGRSSPGATTSSQTNSGSKGAMFFSSVNDLNYVNDPRNRDELLKDEGVVPQDSTADSSTLPANDFPFYAQYDERMSDSENRSMKSKKISAASVASLSGSDRSETILAPTPTLTSVYSSPVEQYNYKSNPFSFPSRRSPSDLHNKNPNSTLVVPQTEENSPFMLDQLQDKDSKLGLYGSSTFNRQLSIQVNQPVGAMSLSPCGRDVALASRNGLLVIDLDNPYNPPRMLRHSTPWEVADAQWNVHAARDQWIVSTSNQKTIVWNLALPNANAIEFMLHGHTRAVTDMNWHRQNPDVLATSSIDSSVHCWDLRTPKVPVNSFYDWHNGATQVKWNYRNPHVLASSHGRFVRIWDDRYGSGPLHTIQTSGSITKINGLEFNRVSETRLLTCAMDRTVKFWDYSKSTIESEHLITTDAPVWKARFTPFGEGVMLMPQRGDNSVHLYDVRNLNERGPRPVHTFSGHTDLVKEFLWRCRGEDIFDKDNRDFQLITWSKDRYVRLWPISKDVLQSTGHDPSKPVAFHLARYGAKYRTYSREPIKECVTLNEKESNNLEVINKERPTEFSTETGNGFVGESSKGFAPNISRKRQKTPSGPSNAGFMTRSTKLQDNLTPLDWLRGISMGRQGNADWEVPQNLGEELSWIGQKYGNVNFEEIDVAQRKCRISLNAPLLPDGAFTFIRLRIQFPLGYPLSASPIFHLEKSSAFSDEQFNHILSTLNLISSHCITSKKPCMDGCISFLSGESTADDVWKLRESEDDSDTSSESSDVFDENFPSISDFRGGDRGLSHIKQNIPLPKTCAAIFCNDTLVCFFTTQREDASGHASINRENHGRQKLFESFGVLNANNTIAESESANFDEDSSFAHVGSSDSDEDFIWDVDEASRSNLVFPKYRSSFGINNVNSNNSLFGSQLAPRDMFTMNRFSSRGSTKRSIGTNKTTVETRHIVKLFDLSEAIPTKKHLAAEYMICGDKVEICKRNAKVAKAFGYHHLTNSWLFIGRMMKLLEVKNKSKGIGTRTYWFENGFFLKTVQSFLDHYTAQENLQMLAMLSCVLDEPELYSENKRLMNKTKNPVSAKSDSKLMNKTSGKLAPKAERGEKMSSQSLARILAKPEKKSGESSSVYSLGKDNIHLKKTLVVHVRLEIDGRNEKVNTKEEEMLWRLHVCFSFWRSAYAGLLDQWGFNIPKLELLKLNAICEKDQMIHNDHQVSNALSTNHLQVSIALTKIRRKEFKDNVDERCAFCNLSIRGLSKVCNFCFHAIHEECFYEWFSVEDTVTQYCPSSCGCHCQYLQLE